MTPHSEACCILGVTTGIAGMCLGCCCLGAAVLGVLT